MEYTCTDYRTVMILLGLERRLNQEDLSEDERLVILGNTGSLRKKMGLSYGLRKFDCRFQVDLRVVSV